jgi:glycosyltransferase involved in cell wall biosynthesis
MKILIITNLFPNNQEPTRGIYNKQQFLELAKLCELEVVAPLPWYDNCKIPKRENIDGIDVYHPRYFMIPKFGRSLYGLFFYFSLIGNIKEIYKIFKFDIILATWAYPDGFGSFLISKVLNTPIIIKVHGTDINLHTKYLFLRKAIVYVLRNSNKVIAVSNALKTRLVKIGVPEEKIVVIPNGVNLELFKPMDKDKCRNILNLSLNGKIVLFIGNLVRIKGIEYLIEAFALVSSMVKELCLVIGGDGPLRGKLVKRVKDLGLEGKVKFIGKKLHNEIPLWMNAADLFCLPSIMEGMPNVILEALACKKLIIATSVGGIPEIITSEDYGILVPTQDVAALAEAICMVFKNKWNPEILRRRAFEMDWRGNARRVWAELQIAVDNNPGEA